MSKEKNYVPTQTLVGKQVFDTKGGFVGKIQDVLIDPDELDVALLIDFKSGEVLEIPWSEVQSVEDVILLKKQVKVYETKATRAKPAKAAEPVRPVVPSPPPPRVESPPTPPPPQMKTCPKCGAKAPTHAKFCPKCGNSLK